MGGNPPHTLPTIPPIASMKTRIRLRVALFLGESRTRCHRGESRDTIPIIESAQDLFGIVFLR